MVFSYKKENDNNHKHFSKKKVNFEKDENPTKSVWLPNAFSTEIQTAVKIVRLFSIPGRVLQRLGLLIYHINWLILFLLLEILYCEY